jgi:hypothetical protein
MRIVSNFYSRKNWECSRIHHLYRLATIHKVHWKMRSFQNGNIASPNDGYSTGGMKRSLLDSPAFQNDDHISRKCIRRSALFTPSLSQAREHIIKILLLPLNCLRVYLLDCPILSTKARVPPGRKLLADRALANWYDVC